MILNLISYNNIALWKKKDISEGIDINKTSAAKEFMLCYCWYFGCKFELHVCNKCHDVLMAPYKLKSITILTVKGVDVFYGILLRMKLLVL